jgi:integrase
MAGTILKRKSSYRLQYMFNGERYSKTIKTNDKKIAQLELASFIKEVEKGSFINTNYTFEEFTKIWLKDIIKPNCTYVTVKTYLSYCNKRILPALGKYKLNDINPMILNRFFNDQKKSLTMYKYIENRPISKSSMEKIYKIVAAIMRNAFEYDLISNNPMLKVRIQLDNLKSQILKVEKIQYYNESTYNTVLELLKDENIEHRVLVEIALKGGLRKSEIFGLTWNDVDFENNTLTINKTRQYVKDLGIIVGPTKNRSSIRTIAISQSLIDLLKLFKENNEYKFILEGINMNTSVGKWFRSFQVDNKLPIIRFHDLRHTHAVLLLLKGVDIKTISKRLGHANTGTTSNTYLHFLKELDLKASELLG